MSVFQAKDLNTLLAWSHQVATLIIDPFWLVQGGDCLGKLEIVAVIHFIGYMLLPSAFVKNGLLTFQLVRFVNTGPLDHGR